MDKKVLKIPKTSKFIKLNPNSKSLNIHHPIKLKSKYNEEKVPIEKVEFIFEESGSSTPVKQLIKHIYKEKESFLKKELKNLKQIKSKKNNDSIHSYNDKKKIYSIVKKYISGKTREDENINTKYKKIFPYQYKYIPIKDKSTMHKSISNPSFNISQEMNMESNFMKLGKEANMYTANANYIKNKKVLLFDKFNYDNNEYKPDRAKLFDITRMPKMPKKNSFIYKTTKFRAGHLINVKNNSTYDFGKNLGFHNFSLLDINMKNESIKQNILNNSDFGKTLIYRNYSNIDTPYSYLDNTFQKSKRYHPSDTFYKELMSKKNDTYEQYFKNAEIDKDKEEKEKEINNGEKPEINIDINNNNNEYTDKETYSFLQPYYKNIKNKIKHQVKKLYYKQMLKTSKNDLNGYSLLLSKKKNNMGQPIYFPKIFSSNIKFENLSQKERFEKISESFQGLKNLMENFKKTGQLNELDCIYEYALNKNIDKNNLNIENLNNFYNFLSEKDMPLDSTKSLKENILLALNYDFNSKKNEKNEEKKSIFSKKSEKRGTRGWGILDKNIKIKNKNKNNELKEFKKLMLDLNLQKKLHSQESFSVDSKHIRDELKKEIDEIKNEVINKQKIIENLRNDEDNIKNYNKVFDSNERLYYTWFKNKKSKDLNNYSKNLKLTELYFYNKTKEEIKQNNLEQKFFENRDENFNNSNNNNINNNSYNHKTKD